MNKLHIGDNIQVLVGRDKGKTGKILKFNKLRTGVLVQGINMLKKAVKPTQENPTGGLFDKEMFLNISNVAIISPKTKKPTRVKVEIKDKKKIRIAKKCGSSIGKKKK